MCEHAACTSTQIFSCEQEWQSEHDHKAKDKYIANGARHFHSSGRLVTNPLDVAVLVVEHEAGVIIKDVDLAWLIARRAVRLAHE